MDVMACWDFPWIFARVVVYVFCCSNFWSFLVVNGWETQEFLLDCCLVVSQNPKCWTLLTRTQWTIHRWNTGGTPFLFDAFPSHKPAFYRWFVRHFPMKSCMVPLFSYMFLASSGSFSQVDVLPPFRRLRAECLRVYAELLTVLALTGGAGGSDGGSLGGGPFCTIPQSSPCWWCKLTISHGWFMTLF